MTEERIEGLLGEGGTADQDPLAAMVGLSPLLLVHAQEDRTASAGSMAGWTSTGGTATLTIPGGHHGLFDHARELHDALRSAVDGTTGGAR